MALEDQLMSFSWREMVRTPVSKLGVGISRDSLKSWPTARTTFGQCLEAILIAELVDNDAWERLIGAGIQSDRHGRPIPDRVKSRG